MWKSKLQHLSASFVCHERRFVANDGSSRTMVCHKRSFFTNDWDCSQVLKFFCSHVSDWEWLFLRTVVLKKDHSHGWSFSRMIVLKNERSFSTNNNHLVIVCRFVTNDRFSQTTETVLKFFCSHVSDWEWLFLRTVVLKKDRSHGWSFSRMIVLKNERSFSTNDNHLVMLN
jgi:hypothetical protein